MISGFAPTTLGQETMQITVTFPYKIGNLLFQAAYEAIRKQRFNNRFPRAKATGLYTVHLPTS